MNYAKFAFSDAIRSLQEEQGSRATYQRVETYNNKEGLTEFEVDFISKRDSFYLASIGENNYPYIQHRGGPKGFVKIINAHTLGLLDFAGNKQYISVGNTAVNPHVSLIMVDYPQKARLKLYADMRVQSLDENQELLEVLSIGDYKHRPERIMLFDIKAFDWNCPQHITPRYTVEEIELALAPRNEYVSKLEQEVLHLRTLLEQKGA